MSTDDDEWTIGIGLRRAVVHLLLWGTICLVGWALLVWLITPWINTWPDPVGPGRRRAAAWLYIMVGIGPGWIMCKLLWSKMTEAAGFVGIILSVMSLIIIWSASAGGVLASDAFRPLGPGRVFLLIVVCGIMASWEVVYETLTDR